MPKPFDDFDLSEFWEDSEYAREEYVGAAPSDELIASVETELGYRLPDSYIELMKTQNGGIPRNRCFPTEQSTSWAEDHVAITGILGIGREMAYSLCGDLGSTFMLEEWGYPDIGVCICDCPSAGHDIIMLDYRKYGREGEPEVVHVDQECDYEVTFLAKDFESFIRGLVNDSVYDTSAEDLKADFQRIDNGSFSTQLAKLISNVREPNFEVILRKVCRQLTDDKGYFALHADDLSRLVYDIQFYLYAHSNKVSSKEEYLKAYPEMIAFGDGDFSTRGYAPGFVEDWIADRIERSEIVESATRGLEFSETYSREFHRTISDFM